MARAVRGASGIVCLAALAMHDEGAMTSLETELVDISAEGL